MKITFIRPNMFAQKSSDAMQPLVFAILKSITPSHIDTVLYDDRIEEINYNDPTDLVAMTVETFAAKRAFQIADRFREKGIPVIMGGFHPTLMPDESLEHADSIVIGNGESVWLNVLRDIATNQLRKRYKADTNTKVATIIPDRSIFKDKKYFPVNIVQWGKGCPHNCDFCSIHAFHGTKQIIRPISDVIDEIATLDNKPIFFVDDNLYHNKKLFEEFLIALIPLKKRWACQISVETAKDEKLLDLMSQSGCMMVLLGIESFNKDALLQMNKAWSLTKDEYSEAIYKFTKRGIMIYGTFVFGYDYDTPDAFTEAIDFSINHKFLTANFNPLYPMPGTELYHRLMQENRLTHKRWWIDAEFYYGKTMFEPIKYRAQELEDKCFEAKKKFNTFLSIFYRASNFDANLRSFKNAIIYFLGNFTNRKEIYKKQGKALG